MNLTQLHKIKSTVHIKTPADLKRALRALPEAQDAWNDITPRAKRDWILWILTAKKAETRTRRIAKACDMLSSGKRRVCCFGGINWLIKESQATTKI